MPLLEYRCSTCGSLFERLVQGARPAGEAEAKRDTADCPTCGAGVGHRVLSLFATVRGGDGASTEAAASGGGCCGGSCGCGG
jgi:putative FmdB family regulatory protein